MPEPNGHVMYEHSNSSQESGSIAAQPKYLDVHGIQVHVSQPFTLAPHISKCFGSLLSS